PIACVPLLPLPNACALLPPCVFALPLFRAACVSRAVQHPFPWQHQLHFCHALWSLSQQPSCCLSLCPSRQAAQRSSIARVDFLLVSSLPLPRLRHVFFLLFLFCFTILASFLLFVLPFHRGLGHWQRG